MSCSEETKTNKVKQQLILKSSTIDEYFTEHTFDCDFTVITKGDGVMWGCKEQQVHVNAISITASWTNKCINHNIEVYHDSKSDIYKDSGFTDAITDAVGFKVRFTESDMQKHNIASMEAIIDIE